MKVYILVVCLFVVVSAGFLYGQGGANGTILGTVTDNSGAVLANAGVEVTNVATNVRPIPRAARPAILRCPICCLEPIG